MSRDPQVYFRAYEGRTAAPRTPPSQRPAARPDDPIRAGDLPRGYSERDVLLRCLLAAIAAGPLWIIITALLLTIT